MQNWGNSPELHHTMHPGESNRATAHPLLREEKRMRLRLPGYPATCLTAATFLATVSSGYMRLLLRGEHGKCCSTTRRTPTAPWIRSAMGAAWQRPTVGDFVLVSGHSALSRSRRWGQLFADDGEQDRPFLVRFHDGMEPELSWCDLERVRTVDKALEDASDQEEEYQCPICFTPFEEDSQVVTPCGHCFCRSCIESALAACQTGDPTERPCPLCRQTVSLFALKMVRTGQRIHFLSDDLSCLNGSVFVLRSHSEARHGEGPHWCPMGCHGSALL
eukprot:s3198_g6.t1